MKFLRFIMNDIDKTADVAQASDKAWASPPPGVKMLASYAFLGLAFPGQPSNTLVSIDIVEAESAEAITAVAYPVALTGATMWHVPVLELPVAATAELEKKFRG